MADNETLEIASLEHFVHLLNAWHTLQVKKLEHMMEIPKGTEAVLSDGQEPVILDGPAHEAFVMGLTVALNLLGKLPFGVEYEPEASATGSANE